MDVSEIAYRVNQAIDQVCNLDLELFAVEASEWAIAHRLAYYLEAEFSDWNVDCEYNRQGSGQNPKKNVMGKKVRPDITIHRRMKTDIEHNLLVIELKKREDEDDWDKVCELTSPPAGARNFQYQYGLALSFFPEIEFRWYKGGVGVIPNSY